MTKQRTIILILFLLIVCSSQAQSRKRGKLEAVRYDRDSSLCSKGKWQLVFEDDFNGDRLDTTIWQLRPWGYGSYGNVQEYNTLDNAIVSNGTLKIAVREEHRTDRAVFWMEDNAMMPDGEENLRTFNYSSSSIWTRQKFSYGKFEARIRIPKGKGLFPAFWLFGDNPWNEIDIFEFWYNSARRYNAKKSASTLHATVHYDYNRDGKTDMSHTSHKGVDYSEDFHTYTLIWGRDKIEWFVDGQLIREYYSHYTSGVRRPVGCELSKTKRKYYRSIIYPQDPMQLILNVAVQSGDDAPDNTVKLPASMEVDWVRCYELR